MGKRRYRAGIWVTVTCLILPWGSCIKFPEQYAVIPPGPWRGTLQLAGNALVGDAAFDERTGGDLPFNFDVTYVTPDSFHMIIHNGESQVTITDITYGHRLRDGRDTLKAVFPDYSSYIMASYEEDAIEGFWYDPSRPGNYQIGFKALHGKAERFELLSVAPKRNLTGVWKCTFGVDSPDPYLARAVFRHDSTHLECILVTHESTSYLEGGVEDDRAFASYFDGKSVLLLEAKILDDGALSGIYRTGLTDKQYFSAVADPGFQLPLRDSTESDH